MGLDLQCPLEISGDECDKKTVHLTYSYIHVVRYILTEMTIDYLRNIKFREPFEPHLPLKEYFIKSPHDRSQQEEIEYEEQEEDFNRHRNELINFLSESLNLKKVSYGLNGILFPINYDMWNGKQNFDLNYYMNEFGILGLKHFVNHSDCEGYFSYGECIDIMNLLSRVFDKKFVTDETDYGTFEDLIELLKTTIEQKSYILFG